MSDNFNKAAEKFMETEDGRKISGKKKELEALADTRDGRQVKAMLQKGNLEEALSSGDTDKVKQTISNVLQTESGARLMEQLRKMMEK